jgi:hypothetical protein
VTSTKGGNDESSTSDGRDPDCRPKFSAITQHELLVGTSNASWLRRIRVRCDRQGHWIRRVGTPRNTRLTVLGHAMYSDGHYCYTECATGWTSVYSVP